MFEKSIHSLKGTKHILDIRNFGFAAGLTIASRDGDPTIRPVEIATTLWQQGFYVRYGGDTIQLGLPFITQEHEIDRLINAMGDAIEQTA